jgi:hypothetical protein
MLFLLPLPDLVEQNGAVVSWPPPMLDQHPCLLHYYYSFGNQGMALLPKRWTGRSPKWIKLDHEEKW